MNCPTEEKMQVLHAHTTMSVLDGASSIKEYVKYCKKNELPTCSCTEHGYALGFFELFTQCKKEGVRPSPGVEFYLKPRANHVFASEKPYSYFHITVWAMNQAGYNNLVTLSTRSWSPGRVVTIWGHHRPCITFEDLILFNEGLMIGSGCIEGPIGKPLLQREDKEAFINAVTLWNVFKGRMFFEVMPHAVDTNYHKDDVIQVNDEKNSLFTFLPEDIMITDLGEITAQQALEGKAREILMFKPGRKQNHTYDENGQWIQYGDNPIPLARGSWAKTSRTFAGNECRFPKPNGIGRHACMQLYVNNHVVRLARRLEAPIVMTLDSHFVTPDSKKIQDILLQNGNKDGWRFSTSYHMQDTQEAWQTWQRNHSELPEFDRVFAEGVENNRRMVEMVDEITLPMSFHLPEVEYPYNIRGNTEDEKMNDLIFRHIAEYKRLPQDPEQYAIYLARLRKELKVIANNPTINFLPYFITVHDICRFARDNGELPGPGRGSACGSLLSYLLRITDMDPIEHKLSFERFLSLGRIARGKFPDIDLDFGNPKTIVEWLAQKYGDKFARISTTSTMKPKGAIRDVARVMLKTQENPSIADRVNKVCESLPKTFPPNTDPKNWLYGYIDKDDVQHPGVIDGNTALQEFFLDYPDVKVCVDLLLDIPKSLGRHASAYCISDVAIGNLVPMCVIGDEVCTQFTMGPVEKMGLIKMDLLGINTLKDISGCLKLIEKRHGLKLDPWNLWRDEDDKDVFDNFCKGRTETVFQFKSAISTKICQQVKPRSLIDLASITANGRPGTMNALLEDGKTTLIDAWIMRRQGRAPVEYLHPDLKEILEPTQGIFSFQEQLMAAIMKCCGYSEEQADYIREIVGKKKPEDLAKLLPEIRAELERRAWTDSQIESFISAFKAASGYSFNLSHSVAYSNIGYACMWLKTRYSLEWWNSVLSNSNNEDLKEAAQHCKDMVVPPSINDSDLDFYIIDDEFGKLVFPLGMVKGVKNAGASIVQSKKDAEGNVVPFASFEDFFNRIEKGKVNLRVVTALIWAGAFDKLCGIESVVQRNDIYRTYLKLRKTKKSKIEELVDLTEEDVLIRQMEMLAIGSCDFVELVKRKIGISVASPDVVAKMPEGAVVKIAGAVQRVSKTVTKKDKKTMAFIDLVNESAVCSVTVFPKEYDYYKSDLKENSVLVIEGKINHYLGKAGLVAQKITPLKQESEVIDDEL